MEHTTPLGIEEKPKDTEVVQITDGKPHSFFDLPLEIRLHIYAFVFGPKDKKVKMHEERDGEFRLYSCEDVPLQSQLLRVNRAFRAETLPAFWDSLTITVHYCDNNKCENGLAYLWRHMRRICEATSFYDISGNKIDVFGSVEIYMHWRFRNCWQKHDSIWLANLLLQTLVTAGFKNLKYLRLHMTWYGYRKGKNHSIDTAYLQAFEERMARTISEELDLPVSDCGSALVDGKKGFWIDNLKIGL